MNDAAQIRRCNGGLRPKNSLLQTPNPKISNREALQLETHVTHTKQRAAHRSNRERNAFFSDRVRADHPTHCRPPIISNRESLRFPHRSNRKNNPLLSNHNRPTSIHPPEPTRRKIQRNPITQFNKHSRKRGQKAPSKNVSVKKKSAERFQSLTQILIEPMFRLEMLQRRIISEQKCLSGAYSAGVGYEAGGAELSWTRRGIGRKFIRLRRLMRLVGTCRTLRLRLG
jgi:hypothetical protein